MNRRELGAGTVSVMWIIVLVVLLLACFGFVYSQSTEVTNQRQRVAALEAEKKTFDSEKLNLIQDHQKLSDVVGFRGELQTNVDLVTQKLDELRGRFPNDLSASDTTLEAVLAKLLAVAETNAATAQSANQQFDAETAKRTEVEKTKQTVETSLNGELTKANGELRDERDRSQNQKSQDDTRVTTLQQQVDDVNAKMRELESQVNTTKSTAKQEVDTKNAQIAELRSKVKLIGSDDIAFEPDGEVVSVGETTGLVFLNIGSRDLLRAGVRFDTYRYGKGGELIATGQIEVREVHPEYAVAGVIAEINKLDPIAKGNVIANPMFARGREKVFALVGAFPAYGKTFLESRLKALGAQVESDVTNRVDFLILGEKEQGEDAVEVTEMPAYKRAQELGIQMLRMSDVERFLR